MIVWLILAVMTLAVLAALLLPLVLSPAALPQRVAYDLVVYRDQLAEVDKDVERGLLSAEQAEAAKAEIYRRMLQAEDAEPDGAAKAPDPDTSFRGRLLLAIILASFIPTGAFLMYAYLGSPELPGKPYAARQNDSEFLMEKGAEHLASMLEKQPDTEGYRHLADTYFLLHRYDRAAVAYQRSLELGGSASLWSELGESLILSQGGGRVGPEAQDAFSKALAFNRHDARARFYLGLSEMQRNEPRRAVAIWKYLVQDGSPDAPWMAMVKEHIARVSREGGFDPASVQPDLPPIKPMEIRAPAEVDPAAAEAVKAMNPDDQQAMIRQMVDRLAAKMEQNPDDVEGWKRLAQSYRVLGETEKANAAEGKAAALQAK